MSADVQIIGKSKHVEQLRKLIAKLAANKKDALIVGEAGVGKTAVALSIVASERTIACDLTNVNDDSVLEGLLSEATDGTVLIEELEHASFRAQELIAGFLASRPKGVRVIVTTRCSLEELVIQQKMVDSLHSLLSRFEEVGILPLRERPEDIPLFVKHFAHGLAIDINNLEILVKSPWEENVRQLKSVVDRCISSAKDGKFELPEEFVDERTEVAKMVGELMESHKPMLDKSLDLIEGTIISRTLERFGFNDAKAAQFLGMTEQVFGQKVKKLALLRSSNR
jgi:DNA-binding NtrC family response regulator